MLYGVYTEKNPDTNKSAGAKNDKNIIVYIFII